MSLSSHRSEASYANSERKFGGCSSKQVKLLRKATNNYNRAIRRAKKKIIAADIASEFREHIPTIRRPYHHWDADWSEDVIGVWSMKYGRYILLNEYIDFGDLESIWALYENR